jgi:hypothetical protein
MDKKDIILLNWINEIKESGVERFLSKGRVEKLTDLAQTLFEAKVSYDDCQIIKKKIVKTLVTKEGAKNSGKYKGWMRNVEQEFETCLFKIYGDTLLEIVGGSGLLAKSSVITNWCKEHYGEFFTEAVEIQARTYGTTIHLNMIRDFEK